VPGLIRFDFVNGAWVIEMRQPTRRNKGRKPIMIAESHFRGDYSNREGFLWIPQLFRDYKLVKKEIFEMLKEYYRGSIL